MSAYRGYVWKRQLERCPVNHVKTSHSLPETSPLAWFFCYFSLSSLAIEQVIRSIWLKYSLTFGGTDEILGSNAGGQRCTVLSKEQMLFKFLSNPDSIRMLLFAACGTLHLECVPKIISSKKSCKQNMNSRQNDKTIEALGQLIKAHSNAAERLYL